MTYDSLSRKTAMSDPDMGNWSYNYDLNGLLTSQTNARSETFTFDYDILSRPITKTYPSGSKVVNKYDTLTAQPCQTAKVAKPPLSTLTSPPNGSLMPEVTPLRLPTTTSRVALV